MIYEIAWKTTVARKSDHGRSSDSPSSPAADTNPRKTVSSYTVCGHVTVVVLFVVRRRRAFGGDDGDPPSERRRRRWNVSCNTSTGGRGRQDIDYRFQFCPKPGMCETTIENRTGCYTTVVFNSTRVVRFFWKFSTACVLAFWHFDKRLQATNDVNGRRETLRLIRRYQNSPYRLILYLIIFKQWAPIILKTQIIAFYKSFVKKKNVYPYMYHPN